MPVVQLAVHALWSPVVQQLCSQVCRAVVEPAVQPAVHPLRLPVLLKGKLLAFYFPMIVFWIAATIQDPRPGAPGEPYNTQ